jgi:dTDP-4-amino-4,6-dideoxygalactose transaminase
LQPPSPTGIPLVDLSRQHEQIRDEVAEGWARVVETGSFTDGPEVKAFEEEFAAFSGAEHVIGVASGTDALEIALRAAGVQPGDGVIVPANTFAATAEAVVRMGARVQLCDVDPVTMLIDPTAAEAVVTEHTTAMLPVHLYGQMAPMPELEGVARRHGLLIIADAAQAQGASLVGAGIAAGVTAAATSFYPGKNLGAYGDGGAVITDDADIARLSRSISHHGVEADRYLHVRPGFTSRLDTIQAVVLRAKLKRLAEWNQQRRDAAGRYETLLADRVDVRVPLCIGESEEHVWHLYPIRVANRDDILERLRADGIGAGVHYPVPLHLQEAFSADAPAPGSFLEAERAAASVLSLPLYPGIAAADQERVVDSLRRALDEVNGGQVIDLRDHHHASA